MSSDSPTTIGRYQILSRLGHGAMGDVYKARDPQLDRLVAIKTVRTDLGLPPEHFAEYKRRFYQEAMAAGRLSHANIVGIYDVMEVDHTPYIVMEYVEGTTLADVIAARGAFPPAEAVDVILQVCGALGYAHAHGIVHRDIKPANILVSSNGQVKVSDFGIARVEGHEFTQTGVRLGTPSYMSPEQIQGHAVDGRSDLFSLGAVLYEVLAGEKPFRGKDMTALLHSILNTDPPSLRQRNPSVQVLLDTAITRALAKDPEQRYPDARAFGDALGEAGAGPQGGDVEPPSPEAREGRTPRRTRRAVLLGASCLVIASVGGLALGHVVPRLLVDRRPPDGQEAKAGGAIDIGPGASAGSPPSAPSPPPVVKEPSGPEDGGTKVPAAGSRPADPTPHPLASPRPERPRPAPPPAPVAEATTASASGSGGSTGAPPVPASPPVQISRGTESASTAEPGRIVNPPAPPPPPAARTDVVGRWQGSYQCQRDEIGFSLDIIKNEGNHVDAIFEFFPLAGTPSFPRGSFRMLGEYDQADGSIRLRSAGWLQRPLGFQSHDLEGRLVRNGAEINGRILTTGCAQFALARR